MQYRPSSRLLSRILAKASAYISTVRTMIYAPQVWRTADIHLLFQSPAQLAAQETLHKERDDAGPAQRVLIVIPFRDKWELTEQCLKSLEMQETGGHQVLVALVDNGSVERETLVGVERYCQKENGAFAYRHLRYDTPFNFSALNNWAVRDSGDFGADIVFFCNNDIEFLWEDSLKKLVGFTRDQENAGAVGCTLVYANRRVQHLFVFVGSKIVGSHPHKGRKLELKEEWYQRARPVGAVTGAVTLMKVDKFLAVGGFDEGLPTSYQDVDLCLKMQRAGDVNWVVPGVVMVHHETQTRGREPSWGEAEYVYKKWGESVLRNLFVSECLNKRSEHFVLSCR